MKKLFVFGLFLFCFAFSVQGQSNYKSAIGVRLGGYYDVAAASYKFFISDPGAIELNLGFRPFGYVGFNWTILSVSGSYQYHFPIGKVDGLQWFVGGGVTAYNSFSNFDAYDGFGLVIWPTGGAEYKFANIPLVVSADIRPGFSIGGLDYYDNFNFSGGVSARYVLK